MQVAHSGSSLHSAWVCPTMWHIAAWMVQLAPLAERMRPLAGVAESHVGLWISARYSHRDHAPIDSSTAGGDSTVVGGDGDTLAVYCREGSSQQLRTASSSSSFMVTGGKAAGAALTGFTAPLSLRRTALAAAPIAGVGPQQAEPLPAANAAPVLLSLLGVTRRRCQQRCPRCAAQPGTQIGYPDFCSYSISGRSTAVTAATTRYHSHTCGGGGVSCVASGASRQALDNPCGCGGCASRSSGCSNGGCSYSGGITGGATTWTTSGSSTLPRPSTTIGSVTLRTPPPAQHTSLSSYVPSSGRKASYMSYMSSSRHRPASRPEPDEPSRRAGATAGSGPSAGGAGNTSTAMPGLSSRHRPPPPPPPPSPPRVSAIDLTDLTAPASWYPGARSLRRRVVAHLGPTNSGKTHSALQALKAAPSGIYCGPLRLLACEVADRLASEGLPCNLVTGQEVRVATWSDGRPAAHTSCTVEMADVAAPLDVAVLDEIQMLGDRHRGWAWTRALLGLAVREVHVAGDPAVLPVLRALVAECGDELQVLRYRRLSPLVVSSEALGSLAAVQAGDCVVAFSRRSLHGLRREVVRRTGREACLVYGALPPEARRQQAALFNSPPGGAEKGGYGDSDGDGFDAAATRDADSGAGLDDEATGTSFHANGGQGLPGDTDAGGASSGASAGAASMGRRSHRAPSVHASAHHRPSANLSTEPEPASPSSGSGSGGPSGSARSGAGSRRGPAPSRVLCASDAIGMGLNLNIRRVVFTSLHKYDGKSVRPLQASEVRQIAGRAGRFSSAHSSGHVTVLNPGDLPALHRTLAEKPQRVMQACLLPSSEDLAAYAAQHPNRPLATSLLAFAVAARLGPSYMYGNYEGMYRIASALRHLGDEMSHEEMLLFSTAPADMDDPAVASALLRFAELYCREGRVGPEAISTQHLSEHPPQSEVELKRLEELHRAYDLYVWLCFRLPYAFNGREEAEAARSQCGTLIEEGLELLAAASVAAFGRRHHHHDYHYHQEHQHHW